MSVIVQLNDSILFQHYHRSTTGWRPMSTMPYLPIFVAIAVTICSVHKIEPILAGFGATHQTESLGSIRTTFNVLHNRGKLTTITGFRCRCFTIGITFGFDGNCSHSIFRHFLKYSCSRSPSSHTVAATCDHVGVIVQKAYFFS